MTVTQPTKPATSKTKVLSATREGILEAGALLAAGALVALPTETVYGLGADATNPAAIAALYAAKGRPLFNPLIAHVATLEEALELGNFPPLALTLAHAFWPGPLTLVVPLRVGGPVCELARAGLESIAIRVPDHPVARGILEAAGRPIAAPSANRSGHVSPSNVQHVLADMEGRIAAVVEGGASRVGVESTIIAVLGQRATMLRPGGLARGAIEAVLGQPLDGAEDDAARPLAPGRLASHYAPEHALRLEARALEAGEACLAFGLPLPLGADPARTLNLSQSGNLTEAASNLYAHLRALDSMEARAIAAAPIPHEGLGEAINDRLQRAAAPR